MNWPLFVSVFTLIFIAELPDKTAFATLLMATNGKPFPIFIGVAVAFVIQTIVAVAFGSMIGLLPERWVHLIAGFLFIGFAIYNWFGRNKGDDESETSALSERMKFFQVAWKAFVVIFIAEWGDLTQLATASISARYHESLFTIFCAATLALWSVSGLAVFLGHKLGHVVNVDFLKKISTLVFALVGIYFILTWFKA